jgi:hypothetical protein
MQALFEMKVGVFAAALVSTRVLLALRLRHRLGVVPRTGYDPDGQCGFTGKKKPGGEAGPKAG